MASRVFQQIYNTMDTLIVGHTLGDSSIAAMGACSSIYEMMTGFTFGVGNGLAIVTARCFGRQETERMKKSVASCIVIGITVTLVVTVLATIFMASAVAAAENTGRNPRRILQLHFNSIRFSVCHVCLQPVLRSVGSNRKQLYAACFPDYFIVGKHCTGFAVYPFFRHGVRGAAIATVIAQGISVVLA